MNLATSVKMLLPYRSTRRTASSGCRIDTTRKPTLQSGHLLADEVFDEANVGARYEQPVELKAMDLGMLTRYRLLNPLFTLDAQCDRLRDILWDRRDSLGLK